MKRNWRLSHFVTVTYSRGCPLMNFSSLRRQRVITHNSSRGRSFRWLSLTHQQLLQFSSSPFLGLQFFLNIWFLWKSVSCLMLTLWLCWLDNDNRIIFATISLIIFRCSNCTNSLLRNSTLTWFVCFFSRFLASARTEIFIRKSNRGLSLSKPLLAAEIKCCFQPFFYRIPAIKNPVSRLILVRNISLWVPCKFVLWVAEIGFQN
mmetsp:Transcript_26088/g.38639  ORF Transcript_26088/g.38639 Transcript_26088/m.38639 type:complete len:205 (-) Transcript_26088:197-811(-)